MKVGDGAYRDPVGSETYRTVYQQPVQIWLKQRFLSLTGKLRQRRQFDPFGDPVVEVSCQFRRLSVIRCMHKEKRGFPLFYPQDEAFYPRLETGQINSFVEVSDKTNNGIDRRAEHV